VKWIILWLLAGVAGVVVELLAMHYGRHAMPDAIEKGLKEDPPAVLAARLMAAALVGPLNFVLLIVSFAYTTARNIARRLREP